ncbi:YdcF family protein [Paracraurococcus lichenis]|uniref:YdcF family protein n=1 Tax=Paracraurococcus lichenis TaxID=3064888 RepID=A0ABT9DSL1_9PROT|nr:YdcF family protein [Paracraurococcus sp. LOR1-02]MDO9706815.1 YdcF family protein [Paracraurococcus sp. LOR1-02]
MQDLLFVLSKILWWPLRPGTAAILLGLIGLAALWGGRRWGRWPALAGLGFLALLALLPLNAWVELPLEDRFPRPAAEPAHIDGIVVLGGAVEQRLFEERGLPALNGAAERMVEPVALLRRHPEARLVFTGGSASLVPGALSEADVARRLWRDLGVPEERMRFETESRNTHENAVNTLRLVRPQPGETWLLVTSASHMPRSMGVFRKAGWQVIAWPVNYRTGHGIASWLETAFPVRLQEFEWGTREWVGLLAYWLMGRTDALFPAP